jgi:hypothetical protein
MSKQNKSEKRGQGRPMAVISWPTGKFTRTDVFERMKDKCEPLTVQKHLDWDMFAHVKDKDGNEKFCNVDKTKLRRNSLLVLLPERREPNSANGLGAKQKVFALRTSVANHPEWLEVKAAKPAKVKPAKTKTVKVKPAKTKTVKAKALKTASKSTMTVPVVDAVSPATKQYEEIKNILAQPTPVVPVPVPEVTAPAPEAVTAPEPAAVS